MKMQKILIILCLFASYVFANTSLFEGGLIEADKNAATPQGKAFDVTMSKYFQENAGAYMSSCFSAVKKPDPTAFIVVFQMSSSGKITNLASKPETNIAKCFAAKLLSSAFPLPPSDNYWAKMNMGITE